MVPQSASPRQKENTFSIELPIKEIMAQINERLRGEV